MLVIAKNTVYDKSSPLTNKLMSNPLVNMMITSEFDKTGKVCSIWTKCDCSFFCRNFVMNFASGTYHQASSAIASKQKLQCQKIYKYPLAPKSTIYYENKCLVIV